MTDAERQRRRYARRKTVVSFRLRYGCQPIRGRRAAGSGQRPWKDSRKRWKDQGDGR